MRSFADGRGGMWDAAIERGSYGAHFLIFAERGGDALRRGVLAASTFEDAQRELAGFSVAELRTRLEAAEPWT